MSFIRKAVKELTPCVIAYEEDIPTDELENFIDNVIDYINASKIFKALYLFLLLITFILPLFNRGRFFYWLNRQDREDFLNKLFESRFSLLRAAGTLVGTPIKMVYYNRPEEMKRLGFDIKQLKEEANLRKVTRERSSPERGCPLK